jgi:hypothetical protein
VYEEITAKEGASVRFFSNGIKKQDAIDYSYDETLETESNGEVQFELPSTEGFDDEGLNYRISYLDSLFNKKVISGTVEIPLPTGSSNVNVVAGEIDLNNCTEIT